MPVVPPLSAPAAGVKVIAGQLNDGVYARGPVHPCASVALMVKLAEPAAFGVPVISPVPVFSEAQAGSEPAVTAYVYEPVPPLAVVNWLYAVPTVPLEIEAREIVWHSANDQSENEVTPLM